MLEFLIINVVVVKFWFRLMGGRLVPSRSQLFELKNLSSPQHHHLDLLITTTISPLTMLKR
jgi:hypothetical protein